MSKRFYRSLQSLLLLMTSLVLGASFYFQYFQGLQPCPLCIMQRVCVFLLLMFGLMGLSLRTIRRGRMVAVFQMFFATAGLFFSVRQIWIQSFVTEQPPACMPGLDVLVRYFPWKDVLHALLWGAADCAEVTWRWMGLSMPVWSAFYFLIMLIASAVIFGCLGRTDKS